MAENTSISWTDHTFNPWWGCMKVSPGCTNCYAEAFAKRTGNDVWGPTATYRTFGDKHWNEPRKWNDDAATSGIRHRVFCASMADVFDERGPESERQRLWQLIRETPWLDWQLLTKRPENWLKMLPFDFWKWRHLWLGFTAENQEYFDLRYRAAQQVSNRFMGVIFVSYEPALGGVRLPEDAEIDWLIFGGESGGKRRPLELEWAYNVKADCERIGVYFFMKQMSAITPKKAAELIPADLLIREFPNSPNLATDNQPPEQP